MPIVRRAMRHWLGSQHHDLSLGVTTEAAQHELATGRHEYEPATQTWPPRCVQRGSLGAVTTRLKDVVLSH